MPREKENKEKYFYLTQDGLAILYNDKVLDIVGVYTENLQTCIAIFIFGKKGIALFHDTGRIKLESIDSVCRLLNISSCTVAYNTENKFISSVRENISRIMPVFEKYRCNIKHIPAPGGAVWAKRKESSVHCYPEAIPTSFIKPLHMEIRHHINLYNAYFLSEIEQRNPDMQFDGEQIQSIPILMQTPEQIKKEEKYLKKIEPESGLTEKLMKQHQLFWHELNNDVVDSIEKRKEQFKEIKMKRLDELEIWLKEQDKKREQKKRLNRSPSILFMHNAGKDLRAASLSKTKLTPDEYKKFLKNAIKEKAVDSQAKDGKTALHFAIQGKHFDRALILIEEGKANITIQDAKKQTAYDLAKNISEVPEKLLKQLAGRSVTLSTVPSAVTVAQQRCSP